MRLYQHDGGYEFFRCQKGLFEDRLYVHRLTAVLNTDYDEWLDRGLDALPADFEAHHENGIPWDNRPSNLDVLQPDEHGVRTREMEHEEVRV